MLPVPTNMRVYRIKKGLTQIDLAKKVGISQCRLCNVETNKGATPPPQLLEKIAKVIGFRGEPSDLQLIYGESTMSMAS